MGAGKWPTGKHMVAGSVGVKKPLLSSTLKLMLQFFLFLIPRWVGGCHYDLAGQSSGSPDPCIDYR